MRSSLTFGSTVTSRFIEAYNHLRKVNLFEGAADFSRRTGITISKIKKVMDGEWEVGDMEASAVGEAFPQLRMDWILDGEGPILHPALAPKPGPESKVKGKPRQESTNQKSTKGTRKTRPEAFRDVVSERYFRFIEYLIAKGKVKNVSQFAKRIGTNGTVFTAIKSGAMSITTERTERTGREFPELNMNWLFTGNGNMVNEADSRAPQVGSAEISKRPNLSGSILEKLKECRSLIGGTWEEAARWTGLPQEDFELLEAGQKPVIPQELMYFLYQAGIDINSLYEERSPGVQFRQENEVHSEEILRRLNMAENSVLEMQKSNRDSLAELQLLRSMLYRQG